MDIKYIEDKLEKNRGSVIKFTTLDHQTYYGLVEKITNVAVPYYVIVVNKKLKLSPRDILRIFDSDEE